MASRRSQMFIPQATPHAFPLQNSCHIIVSLAYIRTDTIHVSCKTLAHFSCRTPALTRDLIAQSFLSIQHHHLALNYFDLQNSRPTHLNKIPSITHMSFFELPHNTKSSAYKRPDNLNSLFSFPSPFSSPSCLRPHINRKAKGR